MKSKKNLNKKLRFYTNYYANAFCRKKKQVLICEPSHIETNNIEIANYLAEHYDRPVAYGLPKELIGYARKMLSQKVEIVNHRSAPASSFYKMRWHSNSYKILVFYSGFSCFS